MKLSRRALLAASLGMGQAALLTKFGLERSASAGPSSDAPSKLLVLYLQGGCRFQTFFVPPGSAADVASFIPPPSSVLQEPINFKPDSLVELGAGGGGFPALRIARTWNAADPKDRTGFVYTPAGYGWVHYGLGARTSIVHGVDQGAFDHQGAYVSAMCGVPGASYRAPSFVSVVANFLNRTYADTRPLPCVAIRQLGMPSSLDLPSAGSPILIDSLDGISGYFSADPAVSPWWKGHEGRSAVDLPPFGVDTPTRSVPMTQLEQFSARRTRQLRGRSTVGTDEVLKRLYDGYALSSSTLAHDVVKVLAATKGAEQPKPDYASSYTPFGVTFGTANGGPDLARSADLILRLLKSDLTSVVYGYLDEFGYDLHAGLNGHSLESANLRGELDAIARILGELKATPAPGKPGKTLYDDTLVVVMSEFGRTWARGPNQSSLNGWDVRDDHFNFTSVVFSGGNAGPNRQIGGFDLGNGQVGLPVAIREESGDVSKRVPRSADVVATVCNAFGMKMGTDFFVPGGYGVIEGATV